MVNPFVHRKILRNGEEGRAVIMEMDQPEGGRQSSNCWMSLEVSADGVEPYRVRDQWMISGVEPVKVGSELVVRIDPADRDRVAIDWKRVRADASLRADRRREVLEATLSGPVPVPAAREALGITGPAPAASPATIELGEEVAAVSGRDAAAPPPNPKQQRRSQRRPGPEPPSRASTTKPRQEAPQPVADDMIERLERLAALHGAGALTDGEFTVAKAHVLGND